MSKKEQQSHWLRPEDFLTFIELDGFLSDWTNLSLADGDLAALQMLIMRGPEKPPVIKGTGGLRKVRFAPKGWGTGEEWSGKSLLRLFSDVLNSSACHGIFQE